MALGNATLKVRIALAHLRKLKSMSEVEASVEHELPNQREWSATTHATRTCIFRGIVVPP